MAQFWAEGQTRQLPESSPPSAFWGCLHPVFLALKQVPFLKGENQGESFLL